MLLSCYYHFPPENPKLFSVWYRTVTWNTNFPVAQKEINTFTVPARPDEASCIIPWVYLSSVLDFIFIKAQGILFGGLFNLSLIYCKINVQYSSQKFYFETYEVNMPMFSWTVLVLNFFMVTSSMHTIKTFVSEMFQCHITHIMQSNFSVSASPA